MAALCATALAGDYKKAKRLHYKLLPLINGMELEVNPVPVKAALALLGRIQGDLRSPLAPLSKDNTAKLKTILKNYKLMK
jgi:4-hydroxy-tetrahydrodipicolinate synthase